MSAKRAFALIAACLMLLLTGCAGGNRLGIKVASPTGEVDTVAPEIRSFMESAGNYTEGDYSYSEKTVDDLGNLPVPVRFSWTFKGNDRIEEAAVLISKDKTVSSPYTVSVEAPGNDSEPQSVDVYNLETGARYYWCVEAKTENGEILTSKVFSFDTKAGPRILRIPGTKNARDLGGWPTSGGGRIKEGILFRSAALDDLGPEGTEIILNDLGIKTELDLRNRAVEEIVSPLSGRLDHVNVALLSYKEFLKFSKSAKEAARILAVPGNYPVLFHCVAGADRTGCLAFLLGALCGVDETDLVIDYELTDNRFRMGVTEDDYFLDFPGFVGIFRSFSGETYQDKARWFLKNDCKLSDMEIYNIAAIMTSDAAVFTEPPKSAVKVADGQAVFEIDSRSSGEIKSVAANGVTYKYSYRDNLLTVETGDTEETTAVLTFSDGTEMPLVWE